MHWILLSNFGEEKIICTLSVEMKCVTILTASSFLSHLVPFCFFTLAFSSSCSCEVGFSVHPCGKETKVTHTLKTHLQCLSFAYKSLWSGTIGWVPEACGGNDRKQFYRPSQLTLVSWWSGWSMGTVWIDYGEREAYHPPGRSQPGCLWPQTGPEQPPVVQLLPALVQTERCTNLISEFNEPHLYYKQVRKLIFNTIIQFSQ